MFSPLKETHTTNHHDPENGSGKKQASNQSQGRKTGRIVPLQEQELDSRHDINQDSSGKKMNPDSKKVKVPVKKVLRTPQKGRKDMYDIQEGWDCGKCGHANAASDTSCSQCRGKLPVVALFKTSRKQITLGEPIRLSWEVFDADTIDMYPSSERVPAKGMMDVYPDETTQYTLVARNKIGAREISVEVVLPAPRIRYFDATDTHIQIGFPTIFHWEVENGAELELDMGIGNVTGRSFTEALLTKPGICTLTARNKSGIDTATLDLSIDLPEILSFYAGNDTIRLGEANVLHWDIANAEKIFLEPANLEFFEETGTEVYPDKTTTYTLRAVNDAGEVSESLTLHLPPPKILHFGTDKELSTEGEPIELFWNIENAFQVSIDHGIGEVEPSGHTKFKPVQAYTYLTLTATGHSGEVKRTIQLTRFPIPLEESLMPLSPELTEDMDFNDQKFNDSLRELENLEEQLKRAEKQKRREALIKKAQEMELTEDMLAMKKPSIFSEIQSFLKKIKPSLSDKDHP